MNTYKITNITNTAGKRDFKFNTELDIEYIDNITKKTIKVKPGDTVYLTVSSLPLSVHRLRIKNLITVAEVSAAELSKILIGTVELVKKLNDSKSISDKNVDVEEEEKTIVSKTASNKKKLTKKEDETNVQIDT